MGRDRLGTVEKSMASIRFLVCIEIIRIITIGDG